MPILLSYCVRKSLVIIRVGGVKEFPGESFKITVNLGDKERFDKEQIGVKEPFLVTKCQFTS